MPYCSNCGAEVTADMSFCPHCGNALATSAPTLQASAAQVLQSVEPTTYTSSGIAGDYRVLLLSTGTCTRSYIVDVLSDLLGYTELEVNQILQLLPSEVAQGLTREQAVCLAQALYEYGMEVSVCDKSGYVNIDNYGTQSVYDQNGSLIAGALAILGTLTLANRISRFKRWELKNPFQHLFAPRYKRPAPPKHQRRPLPRREAPQPDRRMNKAHPGSGPSAIRPGAGSSTVRPVAGPSPMRSGAGSSDARPGMQPQGGQMNRAAHPAEPNHSRQDGGTNSGRRPGGSGAPGGHGGPGGAPGGHSGPGGRR